MDLCYGPIGVILLEVAAELPDVGLVGQFQSAFDQIFSNFGIELLRGVVSADDFTLLSSHLTLQTMQKNFQVRRSSRVFLTNRSKLPSDLTSRTRKSKATFIQQARIGQEKFNVIRKVAQTWKMVAAMGMEAIQPSIIKYIKKTMETKVYHYKDTIMELLRSGCFPRTEQKWKDYNFPHLHIQIEKMGEELETFLLRRFSRDIEIMQARINHSDQMVRNNIELHQYEKLVFSFRPSLISNSTDIARQLQEISNTTATPFNHFNHIQQLRYDKLARAEGEICQLHSYVCQQKADTKILLH